MTFVDSVDSVKSETQVTQNKRVSSPDGDVLLEQLTPLKVFEEWSPDV